MSRKVAVIQARMTSTRLPGKVLADIDGIPLLERIVLRLDRTRELDEIVIATSINDADQPIADLASRLGVSVHRGDEADVLGRVLDAAEAAGAGVVIRITADCPLIDPAIVDACIELSHESGADYVSNVNIRTYPDGLDTEVIQIGALRRTAAEAKLPQLREHVTPYIRGGFPELPSGSFTKRDLLFPGDFSHISWTVDWQQDLDRIREIFTEMVEPFGWLDALSLATKRPHLLGISQA